MGSKTDDMTLSAAAIPADDFAARRLDGDYLLFACGLLAGVEPEAALTLGLAHMHPVGGT